MSDSSANIQFNYLYRDAGNYKVYGLEIFANPDSMDLVHAEIEIRKALIDQEFFDPSDWQLRRLKHDDWGPELDHTWNEFDHLEFTSEIPTQNKSIGEFLKFIASVRKPW